MVLLSSKVHCETDREEFILWLSLNNCLHIYYCVFLVRSITTILTITLAKRHRFLGSSDVLGAFLKVHSINDMSHRIANDFVNKNTSNWQGKENFQYFFRINIPLHSKLT